MGFEPVNAAQFRVMVQFVVSELDQEKEPLICADVVSLICADLRTEDSVNQRFLLLRKKY